MSEIVESNDGGRTKEIVCEDKISNLPNDLLRMILCLVPPKKAVATMILSKRWRSLWSILEYKENNGNGNGNDDDESNISVWWFLNDSVKPSKAPKLAIMCIELGPGSPIDENVEKWVKRAVDHHVVMLKFKLRWSAYPTKLPNDTPTLTSFYITDYLGDSWSIQNMPCLEDDNIELIDYRRPIIEKMLRYFSGALSLELHLTHEMVKLSHSFLCYCH